MFQILIIVDYRLNNKMKIQIFKMELKVITKY